MECNNSAIAYPNINKAWQKFMNIFSFIRPLLTYKPVYEDHFLQGLKELYEDNIMYLELRSTLPNLYDFDGTQYQPEDLVGIYENLTQRYFIFLSIYRKRSSDHTVDILYRVFIWLNGEIRII